MCFTLTFRPKRFITDVSSQIPSDTVRRPRSAAYGNRVTVAFCWSHLRRQFFKLAKEGKAPIATEALARIAELYAIEKDIRGTTAANRRDIRQTRSAPRVEAFRLFLEQQLGRVSQKSKIASVMRYGLRHWEGLVRFLDDGRIEMGRVDDWRSDDRFRGVAVDRRLSPCVGASFRTVALFPVAARQTGHADFPHPAFSCSIKPSRSSGWYAAGVAGRA